MHGKTRGRGRGRASSRRRAKEFRTSRRVAPRVPIILLPGFLVHDLGDYRARALARATDSVKRHALLLVGISQ